MTATRLLLFMTVLSSLAATAYSGDAYFRVPLDSLQIVEGKLPQVFDRDNESPVEIGSRWRFIPAMKPYAVLDGNGEAFVSFHEWSWYSGARPGSSPEDLRRSRSDAVLIRAPQGADVSGLIVMPAVDFKGMARAKFKVSAELASDHFAKEFYQEKAQHYWSLGNRGIPGGAWFRHQIRMADRELGHEPDGAAASNPANFFGGGSRAEDTFDLFTGGRALAENLQLERAMPTANESATTVAVSSIEGITIATIDWSKQLQGAAKPALDPLASLIPADQHAVFFPSFAKLMEVADHSDDLGTRLLRIAEPRSEEERIKERYERQLCVSPSALSRLLGPALVKSVAITGSDPYFATGTDVAVLLDAVNPTALEALISARIGLGAAAASTARPVEGEIEGTKYHGFRSPDRTVCSYIAKLGDAVIVTNSQAQLKQLIKAAKHELPAIASLDEYRFFRTRYARGAADESAFVFLSDATIRRWCGPRWRIASSRRVRDQAVMSELQATYLDDLVAHHTGAGPIHTDLAAVNLGELRLDRSGVTSSVLGSLDFQTPIVEMSLENVSEQEAEFYRRWRDTYQQNWNWAFDPIGLEITTSDKKFAADLTVMPLILDTEYRRYFGFTEGAAINPTAGDPHDAMAHFIVAFNHDSRQVRDAANFAEMMLQSKTNPLSWIGSSIAVYADDDPFWAELAKQSDDGKRREFAEQNLARLPIALHVEVASPLKLTAFLVGLRGMIGQTAPGATVWKSLNYREQPYVKIGATEQGNAVMPAAMKDPAIFYAISGDALIVTPNEKLLKRALDRQIDRQKAKADGKPLPSTGKPWLGSSVGLQLDKRAFNLLAGLFQNEYADGLRLRSWNNLPILNEWKRRYPDQDPVALHERFFQTRLVCPGGGKYVWNEKWQTMESTVFGHPGEPKAGNAAPIFAGFSDMNLGLTFEDHGLRARIDLSRGADQPKTSLKTPGGASRSD